MVAADSTHRLPSRPIRVAMSPRTMSARRSASATGSAGGDYEAGPAIDHQVPQRSDVARDDRPLACHGFQRDRREIVVDARHCQYRISAVCIDKALSSQHAGEGHVSIDTQLPSHLLVSAKVITIADNFQRNRYAAGAQHADGVQQARQTLIACGCRQCAHEKNRRWRVRSCGGREEDRIDCGMDNFTYRSDRPDGSCL